MSMIYLSKTASPVLIQCIRTLGHSIKLLPVTCRTYDPVSSHPDLYMCSLGPGRRVFFGCPEKLGYAYPQNIIYNAACTGRFFIHNLKFTDPLLLEAASSMEQIHVSQGYTKCNMVVIDETSVITSDEGIFRACRDRLDVLLIRPGHVKLRRFPYGFLGGASGRVGETILFNGDLSAHPDYQPIKSFVRARGLDLIFFKEYELEDIGSIIEDI